MTANLRLTSPVRPGSCRPGECWELRPYLFFLCCFKALIIPGHRVPLGNAYVPRASKTFLPFPFRVDISEDGMKALVTLSSGDMRRALNILQVQYNLPQTLVVASE